MGMFSKDRLYGGERLADHVTIGTSSLDSEQVLLLDAAIVSREVPTDIGFATKTALVIQKLSDDGTTTVGDPFEVNTLAQAIAGKAEEKEEGDLPAKVCFFTVEASKDGFNDAVVMQWCGSWDGKTPKFAPLAYDPVPTGA